MDDTFSAKTVRPSGWILDEQCNDGFDVLVVYSAIAVELSCLQPFMSGNQY